MDRLPERTREYALETYKPEEIAILKRLDRAYTDEIVYSHMNYLYRDHVYFKDKRRRAKSECREKYFSWPNGISASRYKEAAYNFENFREEERFNRRKSLGRKSNVHAVASKRLNFEEVSSSKESQERTMAKQSQIEIDNATCLICMGRGTRRRPLINIPCTRACNEAPVHSRCIYEWKQRNKGHGTCPLCRSELGSIDYTPIDFLGSDSLVVFGARKQFVHLPVPQAAGTVRCYIKVKMGFWGSPVNYEMYLQAPCAEIYPSGPIPDEDSPRTGDILLMVAKKKLSRWGCSQIDMSLDCTAKDFSKKSINYAGTVFANFAGLEHSICIPNMNTFINSAGNNYIEIGAVHYSQNRVGSGSGPRRLLCILPGVEELKRNTLNDSHAHTNDTITSFLVENWANERDLAVESQDMDNRSISDLSVDSEEELDIKRYTMKPHWPSCKQDTLSAILKSYSGNVEALEKSKFTVGKNKQPYWLESIHAYSLDFGGRVTLPSNKNFQLVLDDGAPDEISLQFGKVVTTSEERNTSIYTLDFRFPLTPLQAFGIALTSCDRKLACA